MTTLGRLTSTASLSDPSPASGPVAGAGAEALRAPDHHLKLEDST